MINKITHLLAVALEGISDGSTILVGEFQVAANGDFANWATSAGEPAASVGGAMDLAIGAMRLWIAMEHLTKDGRPRIVDRCSYPITAPGCVRRVYTDHVVLEVREDGLMVREIVSGIGFDELQAITEAKLHPVPESAMAWRRLPA